MSVSIRSLFSTSFIWWLIGASVALYFLIPLDEHIRFGMDLAGGTYIGLEVQTDKAVENELVERMQTVLNYLEGEGKSPVSYKVIAEGARIALTFDNEQEAHNVEDELYHYFGQGMSALKVSRAGNVVNLSMSGGEVDRIKKDAVTSNIEVLKSRLDNIGVSETPIAAQGENRIFIELPDIHDPLKAKKMIGSSAVLEFKHVEAMGKSEDDILDEYDGILPDGMQIIPGREDGTGHMMYYLVPEYAEVTGKLLKSAYAGAHPQKPGHIINFKFKPGGAEKFGDLTEDSVGSQIAIVLDDKVISAPSVNKRIEGDGYIEGNFTSDSAKDLASLLKSGAFVAPVTFEEERHIEPSLGRASVEQGLFSCIIGLGLLLVFGVIIYKVAGFFAFLVLLFNLLLILLALAALGGTLTLPGIAGMVLTTGMAIDSSILIFEKIKELIASGKSFRAAINEGFSDASTVILDANITTFIVGAVLYWLGTGPIQGFAVTMMIGIITTLLTGLFLLKSIFVFMFDVLGIQKVKI